MKSSCVFSWVCSFHPQNWSVAFPGHIFHSPFHHECKSNVWLNHPSSFSSLDNYIITLYYIITKAKANKQTKQSQPQCLPYSSNLGSICLCFLWGQSPLGNSSWTITERPSYLTDITQFSTEFNSTLWLPLSSQFCWKSSVSQDQAFEGIYL